MNLTVVVNGVIVRADFPPGSTTHTIAELAAKLAGQVALRPRSWLLRDGAGNELASTRVVYGADDGALLFASLDVSGCCCSEHANG